MRINFKNKTGGWFKESYRHSLARKGIRTSMQLVDTKSGVIGDWQGTGGWQGRSTEVTAVPLPVKKELTEAQKDARELEEYRRPSIIPRKKEDKELVPGGPAYERRAGREAGLRAGAREPFSNLVNKLRFGPVDAGTFEDELNLIQLDSNTGEVIALDSYRRGVLSSAAFDGARLMVNQGIQPDWETLRKAGLSKFQIDELAQALEQKVGPARALAMGAPTRAAIGREAVAGAVGAVGEVAGGAISSIEGAAETGFKRTLAEGARRFEAAPEEGLFSDLSGGSGSVFSPVNVGQPKVRITAEGDEIVDEAGWLNPMRIGGLDQELKKKDKMAKLKAERARAAERVDYFVDDVFNGKVDLSKADLSSFKDGLKAYELGDREALMKSIFDLEAENYSLKHRISLVDNIRQQILSNKSITDTMLRGKEKQGNFFFNPLTGSNTGSAAYADQTNKMSKTMMEIQKSSNSVAQRVAELKRKLNRLNQLGTLDNTDPKQPVKVFSEPSAGWVNALEEGKGVFKYTNPFKGKTNVVLQDFSEIEEEGGM